MKSENKQKLKPKIMGSVIICSFIIIAGIVLMVAMSAMKTPAAEKKNPEQALKVEVMSVEKKDFRVSISAFGEVNALNTVDISSEVSGLITEVNPRLEEGEIIPEGEILFKIDSDDYESGLKAYTIRKKALFSNMKLAEKEFARVKKLYEKSNTGTLSDVEAAESSLNTANDNLAQVTKLLRDAEKNIERCTVKAPFNARVEDTAIEKGQFVGAGSKVLTIVDDSVLEVIVPVDTSEALMVLDFEGESPQDLNSSWFKKVRNTECSVTWAESGNTITANGFLHRVVKYDSASRTVSLAVRIDTKRSKSIENKSFPIVDGMFCQVVVPGRTIRNVVKVPEHAVSYDGRIKLASGSRLKTVPVNVIWKTDGYSLISGGLNDSDQIITTRMSSPLENLLLDITKTSMVADISVSELL